METLTHLCLAGRGITNEGLAHIGQLTNLVHLELSGGLEFDGQVYIIIYVAPHAF